MSDAIVLLRQEIARSEVTVGATLREHFLGETGHERGSANMAMIQGSVCPGSRMMPRLVVDALPVRRMFSK